MEQGLRAGWVEGRGQEVGRGGAPARATPGSSVGRRQGGMRGGAGLKSEPAGAGAGRGPPGRGWADSRLGGDCVQGGGDPPSLPALLQVCVNFFRALVYSCAAKSF